MGEATGRASAENGGGEGPVEGLVVTGVTLKASTEEERMLSLGMGPEEVRADAAVNAIGGDVGEGVDGGSTPGAPG
jgi:hypothetical protein